MRKRTRTRPSYAYVSPDTFCWSPVNLDQFEDWASESLQRALFLSCGDQNYKDKTRTVALSRSDSMVGYVQMSELVKLRVLWGVLNSTLGCRYIKWLRNWLCDHRVHSLFLALSYVTVCIDMCICIVHDYKWGRIINLIRAKVALHCRLHMIVETLITYVVTRRYAPEHERIAVESHEIKYPSVIDCSKYCETLYSPRLHVLDQSLTVAHTIQEILNRDVMWKDDSHVVSNAIGSFRMRSYPKKIHVQIAGMAASSQCIRSYIKVFSCRSNFTVENSNSRS